MKIPGIEELKLRARILLGAGLHHVGLYNCLLPKKLPHPRGLQFRLQSYLNHYYEQAKSVEGTLYIPELDVTFRCDFKDHMLEPYLQGRTDVYERLEIDYFRKRVKPDDHIVDIGANHGFWGFSVTCAAGPASHLYLVEANPTILGRLSHTVRLNRHLSADILPYAITDGTEEQVSFFLPRANLSGLGSTVLHQYAKRHRYLDAARKITVQAKSLDQLVEDGVIKGMDLLKIDVEYGEDAVIIGGMKAIQNFKPLLIMIETANHSHASEILRNLGYQSYRLNDQGIEDLDIKNNFWGNIIFAL